MALQTPRNKHQVERTPIPPPPRRADGTRVENDGISLSYPEDSTGPTSLHPHPNFKPFLFFTLESSKLLLILLLNKTLLSLEVIGSPSTQTAKVVTPRKNKIKRIFGNRRRPRGRINQQQTTATWLQVRKTKSHLKQRLRCRALHYHRSGEIDPSCGSPWQKRNSTWRQRESQRRRQSSTMC
jgi:hypothetical protein